jgi:hypothetical protein
MIGTKVMIRIRIRIKKNFDSNIYDTLGFPIPKRIIQDGSLVNASL